MLATGQITAVEPAANDIDRAFGRLYNFDFAGAHAAINKHIAAHPDDPFGYAIRSSTYVFSELDRLGILESDFFSDDDRISGKKKLKPDPGIKMRLFQSVDDTHARARAILASDPNNVNALFSMCFTYGVLTDYSAFVEKKQIGSLSSVKKSTAFAQHLLRVNPEFFDAYASTGMAEYVIGSLPFFVRWFVKIENIEGSKEQGIKKVLIAAKRGKYLKPFAKILLAVAYLRGKKPQEAADVLAELTRDYPENPLFRKELVKLRAQRN